MKKLLLLLLLASSCSSTQETDIRPIFDVCWATVTAICDFNARCDNVSYDECVDILVLLEVPRACEELTVIDRDDALECERALKKDSCEWPTICDKVYTY